jgi:hypothetical protein
LLASLTEDDASLGAVTRCGVDLTTWSAIDQVLERDGGSE